MQTVTRLHETPSQTAGPYLHIGCMPNLCNISGVYDTDLGASTLGRDAIDPRITIRGTVFDGSGSPLKDAMIEICQADASGHYGRSDPCGAGDPTFTGFGRQSCDPETGEWRFETIKPGPAPFPDGSLMAPHILFRIVARGINIGLQTRMYFPEDAASIATDPLLQRIGHRPCIKTMIATQETEDVYCFNIHLQGRQETVFFDV